MSIAQGTTHYDYPQVQLTDRPTFADFNPAFNDIDAKLYGLITGASTDHAAIEALQTGLGETDTLLATVKNTADAAKSKADTNEENIGILTTALSNTNRTVATKLDSVAIAEPYDPDAGTYNVGDVVVYNGQRYVCTTAVAVSEPFDADKWTGEDVQTVIDGLNTALSILEPNRNSRVMMGANVLESADLNEMTRDEIFYNRIYALTGSYTYQHCPVQYGILEVICPFTGTRDFLIQRITHQDGIYVRYYINDATGWRDWKVAALSTVV